MHNLIRGMKIYGLQKNEMKDLNFKVGLIKKCFTEIPNICILIRILIHIISPLKLLML